MGNKKKRAENYLNCAESRLEKMALTFAFLILLSTTTVFCAETCGSEAEGGALQSDAKASGHSLQWTKALISKPAPFWEGTAVIKGQMKEIKVTDYRGKYLVFFFLPSGIYICLPNRNLGLQRSY